MSDNFANPLQEAKTDVEKAANSIDGLLNPKSVTTPKAQAQEKETEVQEPKEQESKESSKEDQPEVQETQEPQNEETTQEETQEESSEEVSQEEQQEIQQEQDSPIYKVKVAGQEFDVTLDELKSGYSRDADYRRKTEELAYERKNFQSEAEKQRQDFSKRLQDANQLVEVARQQLHSEETNIDLEKLYDEDPTEASRVEHRLRRRKEKLNDALKATQEAQHKQLVNFVQDQQKQLATKMPDWNDPEKARSLKNDMRTYLNRYGFNDTEVSQIYDHRIVMLINDAMKYRNLQKAKPNLAKKISKPSRVFKSGNKPTKAELGQKAYKEKLSRLKKSGHVRDASDIFLDFLNN